MSEIDRPRVRVVRRQLSGWARSLVSDCRVAQANSINDCHRIIDYAERYRLSICPRGSGCSWGDSALNTGGLVADLSSMRAVKHWDPDCGIITVEPGVTIGQILRCVLPFGWCLASIPGSMQATAGGVVSANVHGRDVHLNGNFGRHVRRFRLLRADHTILEVSREKNSDLFRAVVGGIGLFGLILEIEIQLTRIASAVVETLTLRTRSLEDTLSRLDTGNRWNFAVAWADAFAPGLRCGRGYVKFARWTERTEPISPSQLERALRDNSKVFGVLPAGITWQLASHIFSRSLVEWANCIVYNFPAFIRPIYNLQKPREQCILSYIFLHRNLPGMNRIYGPNGFIELQALIPRSAGYDAVVQLLRLCQNLGTESLFCGLKRHLPDEFLLSFQGDGYSISINLELRGRDRHALESAIRILYEFIVDCGGKVYLAKDEMLPRDLFRKMYPQHTLFLSVKREHDQANMFLSDQARRLLV